MSTVLSIRSFVRTYVLAFKRITFEIRSSRRKTTCSDSNVFSVFEEKISHLLRPVSLSGNFTQVSGEFSSALIVLVSV